MDFEFDSVQCWLEDLRLVTETECMSVLQGKSIPRRLEQNSTKLVRSGIDTIRNESHDISNEFAKLFRCVECEKWKNVRPLTLQVTCHMRQLIQECNRYIADTPQFIIEQQEVVMGSCAKLAQYVESQVSHTRGPATKTPLVNQLTVLGQAFSRLVDIALGYLVGKIVQVLDDSYTPMLLSSAISTVVSLGLDGEHMCYLLATEGALRSLFEVCRADSLHFAHAQALRALATICCVPESILELEKEGGIECLTDILCDSTVSEAVQGEAAGVIAQITSPCLDNFQHIAGFLENVEDLLGALINLCHTTSSHEIFLLGSAAVANITFIDNQACDVLLRVEAPKVLIESGNKPKSHAVFVKDQIATVLANMAALDRCRNDILSANGIPLLIRFLKERFAKCRNEAEVAACERVQQKAAIGLTRLCRDVHTAQDIINMNGVPRLVQLCREIGERNKCDAVLVASLAALRKICSLCATPDMSDIDYHQLIKPRLMDSFLMCSHSDENFV